MRGLLNRCSVDNQRAMLSVKNQVTEQLAIGAFEPFQCGLVRVDTRLAKEPESLLIDQVHKGALDIEQRFAHYLTDLPPFFFDID